MSSAVRPVPWDSAAFGFDVFEVVEPTPAVLASLRAPGHYTVKLDPLASKESLQAHGFHYCDTLIDPFCAAAAFVPRPHPSAACRRGGPLEPLEAMSRDAFAHGRFHRDFEVAHELAERRYANWLRTLHREGKVLTLDWDGAPAGFIAHEGTKLVLHAMDRAWRGRGIAKHLWSAACALLVREGAAEVSSTVSAANLAVVNLYASLGFRFRNPLDVYHRRIR